MKDKIKVGFCIAYDWYLLEYSLQLVYDASDTICLSIDVNRVSWSGLSYHFDEAGFRSLINRIDIKKKIILLEDSFYERTLSPMQNEVLQRNRMAELLEEGGWHIQLDCDEYFIGFDEFVTYLQRLPRRDVKKTNICCAWVILYKKTETGFLCVNPERSENVYFIQVATMDPHYEYGRRNGNFNIYTPFYLLHQSWARSTNEILEKILNWGHSSDFDYTEYFASWNHVNETNYHEVRDFHPTNPKLFPSLQLIKGCTVNDVLKNFRASDFVSFSRMDFLVKNSKTISRLKKAISFTRTILKKTSLKFYRNIVRP